ncbi:hypothetical protein B0H10DRAFT_2049895 [Mycena sp. CBHHK59/15]|nr:hypothetical protein B0H10DRAFT_2049895 [Mycena sp. CBHHK59/15]
MLPIVPALICCVVSSTRSWSADRFMLSLSSRWIPTSSGCQMPVQPPGTKRTMIFG